MQQTSLDAFYTLENLRGKQQAVYSVIYNLGEACNFDIANKLGWEINRVTPRTNELVKMGKVDVSNKRLGPTGRTVIYWKIK